VVHIVIGHVVGTVTLLMMFFAVGSYYQSYYNLISQNTYDLQLKQVSTYLASNIIDLVTIAQTTTGDQFIVKQVKIPYSIRENLYEVSLAWMPSPSGDFQVARLSTSISKLDRYVTIDLPYPSNSNLKIYSNEFIPGYLRINNKIISDAAQSEAIKTNKATSMMIWCKKTSDIITIGFGVIQLN
jgi:hypothetical protein